VALGRSIWFTADEWNLLAKRTAWNLGDLFRPDNQHWLTVPTLIYRLLWWLVGLRTHLPYLVIAVATHLTVAALLRAVMRRALVTPWIATVAASSYLFFGPGVANVEFAFQMAWSAALAFSLGYLLLIDHDGGFDRRDAVGLGLGLAALMCCAPAVAMTTAVMIAVLLRRGWRIALRHAAPLGTIFLVWWTVIGRSNQVNRASLGQALRFMARNLWATFRSLGYVPGVGILLVVLLVGGMALAWRNWRSPDRRVTAVAPLALLLGAPLFLFLAGVGRGAPQPGHATLSPNVSRYLGVTAAMVLPAVAYAADKIVTRSKWLIPAVALVLVVGIPGNVARFREGANGLVAQTQFDRWFIPSVPRNPIVKQLPRSLEPNSLDPDLTVGWLVDSVPSGRIPAPRPLTPTELANQTLILALRPSATAQPAPCRLLRAPAIRVLHKGDSLRVSIGRADVIYLAQDGGHSLPTPLRTSPVVALAGPLRLRLVPIPGGSNTPTVVCG
jgi:hypothetical protein